MTIAWIALGIVLILVTAGSVLAAAIWVSDYDLDGPRALLLAAGVVLAVIVCVPGMVKSFIAAGRNINETSCASFADQTGYETKVIVTNMFDTGGCFVNLDGRWVPREQLWGEMRNGGPS